jgi:hypothetical protein
MYKKFVSLALGTSLVLGLSACSSVDTTTSKSTGANEEYAQIIRDAAAKLNNTYTDYIISTTLNAPDGDTEYLEVVNGDNCYTEYSVDSDNNLGTLSYGSADTISYVLTDWFDAEQNYYIFSSDEDGNGVVYTLPSNYADFVSDRPFMYVNDLLDNAISIDTYDTLTIDLGEGEEDFTTYKIKVSGDSLKSILGASSYGVYKSIAEDEDSSANIVSLCNAYLDDLNMSLTFSDANVIVGIDSNNILKYMCLETGGLGTRLYFTKAVVATRNNNLRDMPDVSNSIAYSSTLTDLADYVAEFDSYEDAMNALYSDYYDDYTLDEVAEDIATEVLTEEGETTEVDTETLENKED